MDRLAPRFAVNQELHAPQPALNLPDPGHDPHGMQEVRGRLIRVISLRDREDQATGLGGGLDGARVPGRPAVIGTVTPGKRTAPRNGRTGKDLRSAMMGPFSGFPIRETPRGGLSVSCAKANRFPPDRGFGSSLLNSR